MRYLLTKYNNIIFLAVIAITICANIVYAQTPGTIILGRPTDTSITANIITDKDMDVNLEYGTKASVYNSHTNTVQCIGKQPMEVIIEGLQPDTQYYYRMRYRQSGKSDYATGNEYIFHTERLPGSAFTFAIQGDSHPERINKMYDPDLYLLTMQNVVKDRPDFYMTLGDDFSIDPLINKNQLNQQTADNVYINQRGFLGVVGSYSPLFLVNGNHEEAAQYLLDGTPNNPAVFAGKARTKFYPLPAPDSFYTGDSEQVEFVGLPKDYYAWTWGDALFVVIDFYWHSPVPVDNVAGSDAGKQRDMWSITLGDTQYQWFKETLEQSNAKYKFVFAHHVLGTGRGGVELADGYEWGGKGKNGVWEFDKMRPGWEMPIHQLMVKNGVTIFFQGHDHLFAYQKKDGIIYQSVPNPADPTYQAFNSDAYTGDILPNSGHLLINVSPNQVKVDYIRSFFPKDESNGQRNGQIAYSYATKSEASVTITKTPGTIILGRPTDKSVTANVLTDGNMNIYFEYGTKSSVYTNHTDIVQCTDKKPVEVVIDNLQPDTQYYYRMLYSKSGDNKYMAGEEYTFHTQRSISAFSFVVEADPHLDNQSNPDLFRRALLNEFNDKPDFLIDLGDTFMSEKVSNAKYDDIVGRYLELRSYFSLINHSVPLFLIIGNHDGEQGRSLNGTANNITVWATNLRKLYYPNPIPDNFYTGNTTIEDFVGLPENYYAWEWGNALFIVLDPYRYTIPKSGKSPDGWEWTLGRKQYDWFRQTLENSESKFKFVFCHHLVGGSTNARGGVEFAKYYEWGGLNKDGSWGFDENRPGWGKPIHQLMVENKVTIFFHGHDHFFDKQDLDGVVYQLVPQPSHESDGKLNQAAEYGYTEGIILPPAGHMRVAVSASKVIVDYVQALLPEDEKGGHVNGEVAYSYTVANDSSPKSKFYDINGDGIINQSDLNVAVSSFGKIGDNLNADVNKDGKVDIIDLILIARHFEE